MTLTDAGDGLRVVWTTSDTGAAQSTLWSVNLSDPLYTHAYQLGVKDVGGDITTYVFDLVASEQVEVEPATVTSTGAAATFPWADLGELSGPLEWRATLNLDGDDVSSCPLPGEDPLSPAKSSFTR